MMLKAPILALLSLVVITALLILSGAVPAVADPFRLETPTPTLGGSATPLGGAPGASPGVPDMPRMLGTPVSTTRHQLFAPAYAGCGGELAPVVNADFEQQVVELTNAERAKEGIPPLKRVSPLEDAAHYFATDMGQDNYPEPGVPYIPHATYDRVNGELVFVCTFDPRVPIYYNDWRRIAENAAYGFSSPQSVMAGWMGSSHHRDNILNPDNWEIGVGYAFESSAYYQHYWVQDFGRRFDIYPLIINDEAATTNSVDVSLYAYGNWDEIRLRNNDDPWTNWMPFQNELTWTLSGQGGEQTVWAEMRSDSQTVTSSDSITFTGAPPTHTATPTATPSHTATPTSTATPTETVTSTSTPTPTETVVPPTCPDIDHNGVVNIVDIALVVASWGATEPGLLVLYDFSGNHVVDVDDIQMVTMHWGEASTC